MTSAFYQRHVFFCCHSRPTPSASCQQFDATALRDYAKSRIRASGAFANAGVRINQAGCLGRCAEGPILVIYPEGVWYTYVDQADIDEIIDRHLAHGQIVDRLRI